MNHRFRHIVLAIVFAVASMSAITARQVEYQTDLLWRMAESLKITQHLDTLADGQYFGLLTYHKHPLNVVVHNRRVTHIGYLLFSMSQRSAIKSPVYDFIERYALETDLPIDRQKSVDKQLVEDGISFGVGDLKQLRKLVGDTTLMVSVNQIEGRRYQVIFSDEDEEKCSIEFPLDHELLLGTDLPENESILAKELMEWKIRPVDSLGVASEMLQYIPERDIYRLPGDTCYVSSLNSDLYFSSNDGGSTFELTYSPFHLVESFANLLTTNSIENTLQVDIRQKCYDRPDATYSLPLSQMSSYFLTVGCKPYFGVINVNGNELVMMVFMQNADYGYGHMLKVKADIRLIFDRAGTMKVDMFGFIPVSKIKAIFQEHSKLTL